MFQLDAMDIAPIETVLKTDLVAFLADIRASARVVALAISILRERKPGNENAGQSEEPVWVQSFCIRGAPIKAPSKTFWGPNAKTNPKDMSGKVKEVINLSNWEMDEGAPPMGSSTSSSRPRTSRTAISTS
jgi:hypothetical protein